MRTWIFAIVLTCLGVNAHADHEQVVANDKGTYVDIAKVTGSSIAGTAFASNSMKLMDEIYFNNTASVVFIGTTSATLDRVEHSNIANGFPILSSATFNLGGKFTGAMYLTCNSGVATCEVRRLGGLNR